MKINVVAKLRIYKMNGHASKEENTWNYDCPTNNKSCGVNI